MQPIVSIITPAYNSSNFIEETIQSVFDQTFEEWEMIIVDDNSSDDTVSIAKRFAKEDSRIKIIELSENSGPATARNVAIELSRGRYIAFLDSDDLWDPVKLERQIGFMKRKNSAFSCTYYSLMNEEGESNGKVATPPDRVNYTDLLKRNHIGCLTAIYDTKKLGKVYMPEIIKRQDYGLWLKILRNGEVADCLTEPLAAYRVRTSSVSSNKMNLIRYHWKLFYEIENLGAIRSVYYIVLNILTKYWIGMVK
jgi:teichuronic acid biosynthesis glycosyltransferase TuaG